MIEKTKALFTFSYGEENFDKLRALGYDVTYIPESQITNETINQGFEVMVCFNPFSKLESSSYINDLKWLQLVSKGINHTPNELQNNQDIIITNNADTTCIPIAEQVIAYLLQIFKQSNYFYANQSQKKWSGTKDIFEVFHKKIGILGTGNIATETAKRLKAFDATILGVNSTGHYANEFFDEIYSFHELDDFWPACDVIISTLPATEQTYHLLCEETFAKMKQGVSIINVSRGSVICEEDLISRIEAGFFRGVAMDVFEIEPLPEESPLWSYENVIVSPHNALYSDYYNERIFALIYENCKRYKEGEPLLNIANFTKGY